MEKQYNNQRANHQREPGKKQKQFIKEKNYFFINAAELRRIDLSRYAEGKTYYGKLALEIIALQNMFIGCGEIEKYKGELYDTFSYVKKEPGKKTLNIPGSSLKGSVYTNLEMMLRTESYEFYSSQEKKARVFFSDLPLISNAELFPHIIPARYEPRSHAVPREAEFKFYEKDDKAYKHLTPQEIKTLKDKENLLILKEGSRFRGFIHFRQLDETRLALLVLAMGSLSGHEFNFKIGGAKNRAMGLIKIEIRHEDSYYSEKLLHAVKARALPYDNLEPALVSVAARMKQNSSELRGVLARIREGYGQ